MSKGAYIGVGGSAKKIKNIYVGVGGVAKKVKKAYIGVNNTAKLWWESEPKYTKVTSATLYSDCPIVLFWLKDNYCVYWANDNECDGRETCFGKADLGTRTITKIVSIGTNTYTRKTSIMYDAYKLDELSFLIHVYSDTNWVKLYYWNGSELIITDVSNIIDDKFYYKIGNSGGYGPYFESYGEFVTVTGSLTKLSSTANPSDTYVIKRDGETSIQFLNHFSAGYIYFYGSIRNPGTISPSGTKFAIAKDFYNSSSYDRIAVHVFDMATDQHYAIDDSSLLSRDASVYYFNDPIWLSDDKIIVPVNDIDPGNNSTRYWYLTVDVANQSVTHTSSIRATDDRDAYYTSTVLQQTLITLLDIGYTNPVIVMDDYIGMLDRNTGSVVESSKVYCYGVRGCNRSSSVQYGNGYYVCLGKKWVYITLS